MLGGAIVSGQAQRSDPPRGRVRLSLSDLEPGLYVLRIEARSRLGTDVTASTWYEEAGLLRLQLGDDVRVQIRPSGTEPKVKLYGEAVDADPGPLLDALAQLAESLT